MKQTVKWLLKGYLVAPLDAVEPSALSRFQRWCQQAVGGLQPGCPSRTGQVFSWYLHATGHAKEVGRLSRMGCVYTEGIVFMEQATGGSQEVTRMEGSQDKLCLHQRSPFTDCFKRQKEASRRLAEVVKDADVSKCTGRRRQQQGLAQECLVTYCTPSIIFRNSSKSILPSLFLSPSFISSSISSSVMSSPDERRISPSSSPSM